MHVVAASRHAVVRCSVNKDVLGLQGICVHVYLERIHQIPLVQLMQLFSSQWV